MTRFWFILIFFCSFGPAYGQFYFGAGIGFGSYHSKRLDSADFGGSYGLDYGGVLGYRFKFLALEGVLGQLDGKVTHKVADVNYFLNTDITYYSFALKLFLGRFYAKVGHGFSQVETYWTSELDGPIPQDQLNEFGIETRKEKTNGIMFGIGYQGYWSSSWKWYIDSGRYSLFGSDASLFMAEFGIKYVFGSLSEDGPRPERREP